MPTVFSALADSTRLDILFRLAPQRLTVGEIAKEYSVSQPAISKQLNILEEAGLIIRERKGRQSIVSPIPQALTEATAFMTNYEALLSSRLSAIELYLQQKPHKTSKYGDSGHSIEAPRQSMKLVQHIKFPRNEVWSAYTTPEDISHWWTPPNTTLINCQVELHKEGAWKFTVRTPNGQTETASGIFKTIIPEHKLEYTDGFGDPHQPRNESLITITFEDAEDGGTILTKEVLLHPEMHHAQEKYMNKIKEKNDEI